MVSVIIPYALNISKKIGNACRYGIRIDEKQLDTDVVIAKVNYGEGVETTALKPKCHKQVRIRISYNIDRS